MPDRCREPAIFKSNKWETTAIHLNYWDCFEINGCKKVEISNNELIAPTGQELVAGKQGAFQVFQRTTQSKRPWTISYFSNKISNLKVGLKIVGNSSYRSPDTESDNYLIDLSEPLSNVTYAASFKYKAEPGTAGYPTASLNKWLPAGQGSYAPDNIDVYDSTPTVINPLNYTIVS